MTVSPALSPLPPLHVVTTGCPARLRAWLMSELATLPSTLERRATVLTATDALAHQLRRHCVVDRAEAGLLLGVSMARPAGLAFEVLARAGMPARRGGEARRRLALRRLFEVGVDPAALRYFTATDLTRRGYVEAVARAIGDLERAGLDATVAAALAAELPEDARARTRLEDVVTLWRLTRDDAAADEANSPCLTAAGAMHRAAGVLRAGPSLVEPLGPVIAVLTGDPDPVLLEFLASLSGCRTTMLDGRPPRHGTQRWHELVTVSRLPDGRAGVAGRPRDDSRASPSELVGLQHRLFVTTGAAPSGTAAVDDPSPATAATPGATETVDLEEYASIEEEVEATVHWIIEQIRDGIALEEIAVIATQVDVYAPLVLDRLARLPLAAASVRPGVVTVLDGRPAGQTAAGRRIRLLLDALARHLPVDRMIALLGSMRLADRRDAAAGEDHADEGCATPSRTARLVYQAGIAGGSAARPEGARSWRNGLERFRRRLATDLESMDHGRSAGGTGAVESDRVATGASARPGDDDAEPEKRATVLARREMERWVRTIDGLLPAVRDLDAIAALVESGASLQQIWPRIAAFVRHWLPVPPSPPRLLERFERHLAPVVADPAAALIGGSAAVELLVDRFAELRVGSDVGGRPALVLASPRAARGLVFRAVRLIGLAEGVLPRAPREDPVLPAGTRRELEELRPGRLVIERVEDQVLADLHDLCRIVMGIGERIALSAPRRWVDGSQRELSGVMLEVAMALGRRGEDGGEGVPTSEGLRTLYIEPGVDRRRQAVRAMPLLPAVELRSVRRPVDAAARLRVPPRWLADAGAALDLRRLCRLDDARLLAARFEPLDGDLRAVWSLCEPPGLTPRHAVSPTRLVGLLGCPYAFMLSRVLGLEEPPEAPTTDRIAPLDFGSLAHRVMETVMRRAGAAICRHEGRLADWLEVAGQVAGTAFDALLESYPLAGVGIIGRERARLHDTVRRFLGYEWERPPRTFVAAERDFGDPDGVPMPLDGSTCLHVRGTIDRIDRLADGSFAVRDYKTGRSHALAEEPLGPALDLQIALYARVMASGAALRAGEGAGAREGTPITVSEAAYVYPVVGRDPDRRFEGEALAELDAAFDGWLRIAHGLLATGVFPRTPVADTCRRCAYQPLCDAEPESLRRHKLAGDAAPPAAARYRELFEEPGESGEPDEPVD